MAKMFPEWISDEEREANPKHRAEFKVYDVLKNGLSDEWHVFYSRTWTWVEKSSRLRTREADFIIAHPKCGIMLLEVKGGRIEIRDGNWHSTDRYGNTWAINPYNQVAIATSSLERKLREENRKLFGDFRFSTAVCFPDVDGKQISRFMDPKHLAITITAKDLPFIKEAIVGILKDLKGNFSFPGDARILYLKELLACSWYLNAPKSIQIYDTENEIKVLTESQFKLLYQVAPSTKKLLVDGCAGSGKTLLAAETASRMARLDKKKVLFTCFNKNLAAWLRFSPYYVDNGCLMIANFHGICAEFARMADIKLPFGDELNSLDNETLMNVTYPNVLLDIATRIGAQFDAIIVDEGQDFLYDWWMAMLFLLKDDGALHVYYDDNQRIRAISEGFPSDVTKDAVSLQLKENIRNTKSIHNLAMKYHPSKGKGFRALSKLDIEPEYIPLRHTDNELELVHDKLEQLVDKEGIPTKEMAILTPCSLSEHESMWMIGSMLGQFKLVHHINPAKNEIFCSSIRSAKGLEFPVVLLTEMSTLKSLDKEQLSKILYVGISRARSNLIVFASKDALDTYLAK